MPWLFWFERLCFESELVRVQYLCITDIGDARIIVEKLRCDLIRNLQGHIPIAGEYLKLYIREVVGNGGLSRRAHVATAFTASVHHRITGSPGFIDDLGDLFQQHLFRDDDELAGLLGHVGYLSKCVFIELYGNIESGSTARYRADLATALVASLDEYPQTATRLGLAAHQCLGEPNVKRYSNGNRNWRADGCGRADVCRGIGRRDTAS